MPLSTTELPIRRQNFITNCASVKCAKSAENQVMPINIYVAQSFAHQYCQHTTSLAHQNWPQNAWSHQWTAPIAHWTTELILFVISTHGSLVVNAMLKHNSRMGIPKTCQTRSNIAASEDETNTQQFSRIWRREVVNKTAAIQPQNYIKKKKWSNQAKLTTAHHFAGHKDSLYLLEK